MAANPPEPVDEPPAPPAEPAGDGDALLTWDGPAQAAPAAEPADGPPAEAAPPAQLCPSCRSPRLGTEDYCADCGWVFPNEPAPAADPPAPATRINDRYELGERVGRRGPVERFRGRGFVSTADEPIPVVLLRAPVAPPAAP